MYYTTNEIRGQAGGVVEYVGIILSPILSLLMPLTFFYWKLKPIIRYLSIFSMLFFLAIYVAIGTNKAIADFILLFPCIILAGYFSGRLQFGRRRLIIIAVLVVFAFGSFFLFFCNYGISYGDS